MMKIGSKVAATWPHIVAAGVGLTYAWLMSRTGLRTTGLQFMMPLVFIMASHLTILAVQQNLLPGFAKTVYRRSFETALLVVTMLVLGSIFAPQPAYAQGSDIAEVVFAVVFCAVIIAIVVAVVIGVIRLIFWILFGITSLIFPSKDNGPDSRLFDVGSLIVTGTIVGVLSLEGVPKAYGFATDNIARSDRYVAAAPAQVWQTLGAATSVDFPLPAILSGFPRPVEVAVDEGVGLGANRVVRFEGREGAGALALRVTERTDNRAVFTVLSDTSPVGAWVGFKTLTYHVVPDGDGTRLSVAFTFERKLAPAWFFGPMMRGAATLAADVLVRDVQARADG